MNGKSYAQLMTVDSTVKDWPTSSFLADQDPLTATGEDTWELPEEMSVILAVMGLSTARAGDVGPQMTAAAIPMDAIVRFMINPFCVCESL